MLNLKKEFSIQDHYAIQDRKSAIMSNVNWYKTYILSVLNGKAYIFLCIKMSPVSLLLEKVKFLYTANLPEFIMKKKD